MPNYYIGADVGGTNIEAGLYTTDFEKIQEYRTPTEAKKGAGVVLDNIYRNFQMLLKNSGITQDEIIGIGVGIPGIIDIANGVSVFAANFSEWENVPIADYIFKKMGVPAFIDNDSRVNLYGEWQFGTGKRKDNIVMLTLGTGLGSAIVVDGHMLYGACDSAGEMGHMNMFRTGRPCKCGSEGCFGRYVSAQGLITTVQEKISNGRQTILSDWANNSSDGITAKMVSEAYDIGDKVSIEAMTETGEILGFGLTNAVNLFNPDVIIIGGGLVYAGERLLKPAISVIEKHALAASKKACNITVAALGDAAGMIGAAVMASKRVEKLAKSK